MNQPTITDADLQAYVDDRLPSARQADVETFLREHPDVAERVRAYAAQNAAIRTLHRETLDEAIPEHLLRAATGVGAPPKRAPWFLAFSSDGIAWRVAAGLVIACIGAMAGWAGRGTLVSEASAPQAGVTAEAAASLPRWAAMAHRVYSPDMKRPVELGAHEKPLLVKWLSRRLRTPIRPPTLSAFGYSLIGGRLLSGPQGPVAQFMYQDASGQRLTLYVSGEHTAAPREKEGSFRFAQEGSVNVYYWFYDKLGYALSADIPKTRLEPLAASACRQLETS